MTEVQRLGIDLDNTLVCYDQLFWELAFARGLIDESIPKRKDAVRDECRRTGREADWTGLQGEVYGPLMVQAAPFPDTLKIVRECQAEGWLVSVISHRSRTPFAGPAYDLHASARDWLEVHGFTSDPAAGLSLEVWLETEKSAKLARIVTIGCQVFIDDLPELLTDARFPLNVRRILFDPHGQHQNLPTDVTILRQWRDLPRLLPGLRP